MSERYRSYLQSESWRWVRERKLKSIGFKCEHCGNGGSLHVHHLRYGSLGKEPLHDLMALCARCHELIEAWIQTGEHSRKGRAIHLKRFTHRRLRRMGIELSGSERKSDKKTKARRAKLRESVLGAFRAMKSHPSA
jgi:hypothetical protein